MAANQGVGCGGCGWEEDEGEEEQATTPRQRDAGTDVPYLSGIEATHDHHRDSVVHKTRPQLSVRAGQPAPHEFLAVRLHHGALRAVIIQLRACRRVPSVPPPCETWAGRNPG